MIVAGALLRHSLSLIFTALASLTFQSCTHVGPIGSCFKTGRTIPRSQKLTPSIEQQHCHSHNLEFEHHRLVTPQMCENTQNVSATVAHEQPHARINSHMNHTQTHRHRQGRKQEGSPMGKEQGPATGEKVRTTQNGDARRGGTTQDRKGGTQGR